METGRGHLGGSVEPSEGKGGESVVAILRFSMWQPPPVSVEDRGVGLSLLHQWLSWERN
jgi:hypothetical protein